REGLAVGHGGLHNRDAEGRGRGRPAGESAEAPAVPTGSTAAVWGEGGGRHQTSGPKSAPQPNRTSGLSAKARRTRNATGIDTARGGSDGRPTPKVPGIVAQGPPCKGSDPAAAADGGGV